MKRVIVPALAFALGAGGAAVVAYYLPWSTHDHWTSFEVGVVSAFVGYLAGSLMTGKAT